MPQLYNLYLVILLMASVHLAKAQSHAQQKTVVHHGQKMEVMQVYDEIVVDASATAVWQKLTEDFVLLGDFHSGMAYSYACDKSRRTGMGALRHCQIDAKTFVKEKITDFDEQQRRVSYEMVESAGLPMRMQLGRFTVVEEGVRTRLIHELLYQTTSGKNSFRKMRRANRHLLLAWRYFIEHDDFSKPRFRELERRYADALESIRVFDAIADSFF